VIPRQRCARPWAVGAAHPMPSRSRRRPGAPVTTNPAQPLHRATCLRFCTDRSRFRAVGLFWWLMAPSRDRQAERQRCNTPSLGLVATATVEAPAPDRAWLKVTRERWAAFWGSDVASVADPATDTAALRRLFTFYDEIGVGKATRARRQVPLTGRSRRSRSAPPKRAPRAFRPLTGHGDAGLPTSCVCRRCGFAGGTLEADDGGRTRDLRLGKPTLYQLSYVRARRSLERLTWLASCPTRRPSPAPSARRT
jgi:hypothetical protein